MFQFHTNRISLDPRAQVQIVGITFAQSQMSLALVVDLINLTDKPIVEVKLDAMFINAKGKFIFDRAVFSHTYSNLSIGPQEICFLEPWDLDERHQTARSAMVRVAEVHFEDGSRTYYQLKKENVYTLPILPLEKVERLQSLFGKDLITYASKLKEAWRCVCGTINPFGEETCLHCERNRDFVLSTLTERRINEKLYSLFQKDQEEDLDMDILAHQSSHEVENIEDLVAKRQAKEAQDPPRQMPLGRKIFYIVSTILALFFLFQTGTFLYRKLDTQNTLKRADSYIASGQYQEALSLYKDLAPKINNVDIALKIEDTQNLIKSEENYKKGVQLTIKNDSFAALYAFTRVLPDDSQNYAKAQAMISSLKQDILVEIEEEIALAQYNEALKKIDDLIYLLPEEPQLESLRQEILSYMGMGQ